MGAQASRLRPRRPECTFAFEYYFLVHHARRYRILRRRSPNFAGAQDLDHGARDFKRIARDGAGFSSSETSEQAYEWARFWNYAMDKRHDETAISEDVYYWSTQPVRQFLDRVGGTVRKIQRLNPPPAVAAWAALSAGEAEKILEGGTDGHLGGGRGEGLRIAYAELAGAILGCLREAASDAEREKVAAVVAACTPRYDAPDAPRHAVQSATLRALRSLWATLAQCFARPEPDSAIHWPESEIVDEPLE